MLGHARHIVEPLGREHVPAELGIEVQRVVRHPQREAEVVHREDVLQPLGVVDVADAARLAQVVQLVRQRVGPGVELVVVLRLVDTHAPQDDGGMVPAAPDHLTHVPHGHVLPRLVADVLPAGDLLQHQQAQFVAGVQEVH